MWTIPALLFLVGFFHRAAPGVMARDLMRAFDVTSASIGSLAATSVYAYAALMIPAGLLLDAFGVRIVLAIGGAIMGGGALLIGAAAGPTLLFAGRFLVGLGAAATFIGTLKIAAAWFPPTRFGYLAALSATVEVLRNPHTWPPFLAFFCLYSAAGNLMLWIVPCLRDVYALHARPAAGAALTQGPLGALLDAHWTGALVDGVRRYPVEAYRTGVALCAALVAGAALLSLLMHETHGRNIHAELRGSPPGSRIGTEPV